MLILFVYHLDKSVQPRLIIIESRPLKRLLDFVGQLVGYISRGIMRGHHLPWTQEVFKNNRNTIRSTDSTSPLVSREDASSNIGSGPDTNLVGRLPRRAETVTVNVERREYDIIREKVRACLLCPIILIVHIYKV